jgi:hypothetical protein
MNQNFKLDGVRTHDISYLALICCPVPVCDTCTMPKCIAGNYGKVTGQQRIGNDVESSCRGLMEALSLHSRTEAEKNCHKRAQIRTGYLLYSSQKPATTAVSYGQPSLTGNGAFATGKCRSSRLKLQLASLKLVCRIHDQQEYGKLRTLFCNRALLFLASVPAV